MSPNFVLLDATLPDVARLIAAMVEARDAVERRSWSHPQEPTTEEWWADVLADPRARRREWRASDLPVRRAFYTLADEPRKTILVACSKCDLRAAFSRDELIASHGAHYAMPQPARPSRRTELQQARLQLGSVRRALRRTDRGRTYLLQVQGAT